MTIILKIDASGRNEGSHSRELTKYIVQKLKAKHSAQVMERNIIESQLELLNDAIISSIFVDSKNRTDEQKKALELSDMLVAELIKANFYVIGLPIYNFGVPAALKAWADLVARARVTFRYTEQGPIGLLEGKKAYIVVTSASTMVGSNIDFATPWFKYFLSFIGVSDVEIIAADQLLFGEEEKLSIARQNIDNLVSEEIYNGTIS